MATTVTEEDPTFHVNPNNSADSDDEFFEPDVLQVSPQTMNRSLACKMYVEQFYSALYQTQKERTEKAVRT